MLQYTLPQHINPNKIFIINRSELEERLDSEYYKVEFQVNESLIDNSKFSNVQLKDIIYSITNGFDYRDYQENGVPYIKVANVKKGEFDFSKLQYINFDSSELTKNIKLEKGNLLLTRKGTFGNALGLEADYNYVISSEVFYIKLKQNIIDAKFLEIYLNSNVGQKQFDRVKIGAIMGSLSQEAIKNLKIPLPPLKIQQQIVSIYQTAYQEKQQKEAQAQKLLESIDDYLLKELGIKIPKAKTEKSFIVKFKEVTGGRFDPKLYSNTTKQLIASLNKSKYPQQPLKSIITQKNSGDWGIDYKEDYNKDKFVKCLVIRATEFDNQDNLNVNGDRVKYRLIDKQKFCNLDTQTNDLLIEKSGGSENQPVGRIAILSKDLTKNYTLGFSNFVHKIRIDTNIANPEYIFNYLKTIHNIKITDVMQSQTNGIRNLILNEYFSLLISLPEIEKQNEIAQRISEIRKEANKLQVEAVNVLEKAKEKVEAMILG